MARKSIRLSTAIQIVTTKNQKVLFEHLKIDNSKGNTHYIDLKIDPLKTPETMKDC